MIIGIGTDILEIARVKAILAGPTAEKFCRRILTTAEQKHANEHKRKRRAEWIAGRFSAKEAVAKALGCGIGAKVGFHDIEIIADSSGKPTCQLSSQAKERLGLGEEITIHVSISHSEANVLSFAV